jgi:DNA-binding response OmpR family regulator
MDFHSGWPTDRRAGSQSILTTGDILIVGSDPELATVQATCLRSSGYVTYDVRSGAEARTVLRELQPDVVVVNFPLPDVDGLVLCSMLKPATDARIIICAADLAPWEIVVALQLGADDVIRLPFYVDEFAARVEVMLRSRRAAHASARAVARRGRVAVH